MTVLVLHPHNDLYEALKGELEDKLVPIEELELRKGEIGFLDSGFVFIEAFPPCKDFALKPEHNPRGYTAPGRARHKKGKR